jgi:hypothetical protein
MLIVPLEDVRVGMKLAADMVHPAQPDQILLRRGYILDPVVISKMQELGVLAIYVDYPSLTDLDRHLAPTLSPEKLRIYGQVKATIAAVQKTARPSVGFADYYVAIREFVITLFQQGEHPLYLEQIAVRLGDHAISHAAAVAHLSLLLGIKLQTYLLDQRRRLPAKHATEIVNLGIAGMLHDIGKCKLAAELAPFCATNTPEDSALREAWETHPRVGYEMVHRGIEPSGSVAILHHHQRFDGTGFPVVNRRGKPFHYTGRDIHVFARILQVANLFDHLTHPGRDLPPQPAFQVLHLLRTQHASAIDPVVFTALQQAVPPFPPGGRVRLSDNCDAVVTGLNPRDPYRPIVRRCTSDRYTLDEKPINLASENAPSIISVEGMPIQDYLPPPQSIPVASAVAPEPDKPSESIPCADSNP